MKTPILITLLLLSTGLFFGCQSGKTESFIPGTYLSHTEGPYGLADDTLTITADGENRYRVLRSIVSRAKRGGKLLAKKLKRKHWQAVYDPLRKELSDQQFGFTLRFVPDSNLLYLQSAKYNKID